MLHLQNISITLANRPLIAGLTISIPAGEIITVMGPSGSGKSSLLSLIGGDLDAAFSATGTATLNDENILSKPPQHRHIGRLFQDDLLFPHMTVAENLSFAIPKSLRAERQQLVETALNRAELEGFGQRFPHTLSGGQRARISLMRTLLAKPHAILLDEPFSKLDQDLRQSTRDYVFSHIKARNIPALLVTHDAADVPDQGKVLRLTSTGAVQHV